MRDPKLDQRPGDVLRKGDDYQTIHSVDRWQWVYWRSGGNMLIDGGLNITAFRRWARSIERGGSL